MAVKIVPEFPSIGEKLPCRSVIDKKINARIAGIAKFLIHTFLKELLAKGVVEPHRPSISRMLYPGYILSPPTEERHPVMPLGVSQKARSSGQIPEFLLLRGPLAREHVPSLYA